MTSETLFHGKDICYAYTEKAILDHVDLELSAHGLSVICGDNGAGKTTLLRIVAGLLIPSAGQIESVDTLKKGWLSAREEGFLWDLTGKENLTFFAKLRSQNSDMVLQAIETMKAFSGFSLALETHFSRCSAGMKKMLLLAHSISMNPNLLILDEPFNHLDPGNQQILAELLCNYSRENHVLLSTHSHLDLLSNCGVMSLKNGKLN